MIYRRWQVRVEGIIFFYTKCTTHETNVNFGKDSVTGVYCDADCWHNWNCYHSSEADLEDVLLLLLRMENYVATFLGDGRSSTFCVDVPPSRRPLDPPRHTLLRHLAALAHVNCRKYRSVTNIHTHTHIQAYIQGHLIAVIYIFVISRPETETSSRSEAEEPSSTDSVPPPPFTSSDVMLKDSLKEEKPHNLALKYARS